MTPGIRRTRSVPQGDPCAADLVGTAFDILATAFCEKCQTEEWGLPMGGNYMGLLLFDDNCWLIAVHEPRMERTPGKSWTENSVGRGRVVLVCP